MMNLTQLDIGSNKRIELEVQFQKQDLQDLQDRLQRQDGENYHFLIGHGHGHGLVHEKY